VAYDHQAGFQGRTRWKPMRSAARIASALCLSVGALAVLPTSAQAATTAPVPRVPVAGEGSSYAFLLLDQWRAGAVAAPYNVPISYQPSGSEQGRLNFVRGTIDFAVSDFPYQPDDAIVPAPGTHRYIPAVAGALGIMFNLVDNNGNRIVNLQLDPRQTCRIFTTVAPTQMFWDDPAIAALNPGAALPHSTVKPIVRADGAGSSFALSEYCIASAPDVWATLRTAALSNPALSSPALQDGRPISTAWPATGLSAPFSTGVANETASTSSSITYIEAGYADITGLPLARLRNASGTFVSPTSAGVTAALSHATIQPNGTLSIAYDTTDPSAYLPVLMSYFIVPTTTIDLGKARTLSEYIYYGLTLGQDSAQPLSFARLPANLLQSGLAAAESIPGATPFNDWAAAVGYAPAPVVPEAPYPVLLGATALAIVGWHIVRKRTPLILRP
jgi:phosphate transport system substrate-binding protein